MATLTAHIASAAPAQYIGSSHFRRARIVLLLGSSASIFIGVPWALFFAFRGDWTVAASDFAVTLAGVVAVQMTRHNRLRPAALVLVISLFVRLVGMATVFDVPSVLVPRSVHHYLIPLGLAASLLLKRETALLRAGLAIGCMAVVVFLEATEFGFDTDQALPDSIREPGTWMHNLSAMLVMFLLLHVFVADIDRLESRLLRWRQVVVKLARKLLPLQVTKWLARLSQSPTAVASAREPDKAPVPTHEWLQKRAQRVQLMVMASSAMLFVFGLGFAVYFGLRGLMPLVVSSALLAAMGLALVFQIHGTHKRSATVALACGVMGVIFLISAVIDVPTASTARATHYWFLPLALGIYFLLRDEPAWIHFGLPAVCLLAFVALASSHWGLQTGYVLPETDRPPPWLICASALGTLQLLVHMLVGDVSHLTAWLQNTSDLLLALMPGRPRR